MASSYPTGLDSFATTRADATANATTQAADHNNYADAVNKIEAELGINPSAAYATVLARLDAIGSGAFPWINAKDAAYGAVGNDINDDTAEIQAALAALPANGGVVYLPRGTYLISGTLDVGLTKSLVGEGRGATVIHYTGSSHAISMGNAAAAGAPPACTARVADLTVRGSGETVAGSIGIRVAKCLWPVLERIECEQIEMGYKFDAGDLWIASGMCLHLRTRSVKYGILLTGNAGKQVNDMTFIGGYMYGSGGAYASAYGVKIEASCDTNHFFGTSVEGFAGAGAVGFWISSGANGGNFLCGTRTEECTTGVLLDTLSNMTTILGHSGSFATPITDNGYANLIISRVEFRRSTRYMAYAASITPDAREGEIKEIGILTGNVTINNATNPTHGMKLTFLFKQDGSGGRTVTWGSAYKVNWTPSTTALLRNTITFTYNINYAAWIQVSSAVGLLA